MNTDGTYRPDAHDAQRSARTAAARKFLADNPDPIVYALNYNRTHSHTTADYDRPDYAFSPAAAALRDHRIADVPDRTDGDAAVVAQNDADHADAWHTFYGGTDPLYFANGTPVRVHTPGSFTGFDYYDGTIVRHETRRDGRLVYFVRDRYSVTRAEVADAVTPR